MIAEFFPLIYNWSLSLIFFLVCFCAVSWLIALPYRTRFPNYELACLLEDVPESTLNGQAYHYVCFLEDIPEWALSGQAYHLVCPLMTPLACIYPPGWRAFYRQNLRQRKTNYWAWRDFPESRNFCPELTNLLDLPQPKGYVKQVLDSCLRGQKLKFYRWRDFWPQVEMRLAFKEWHHTACQLIGQDALSAIYQVCYGTKKQTLEEFMQLDFPIYWWKILGVRSSATPLQVETAYKQLLRKWHPDLNPHPFATEVTSLLNLAYQQSKNQDLAFQE